MTSGLAAVILIVSTLSGCGGGPHSGDAGVGAWSAGHVAPYVDMTLTPGPDLAAEAAATGVRTFTLAFVTAGHGCDPAWGGTIRYDDPGITGRIGQLRRSGGDVRVSFGGARGRELAERCLSVRALESAYRTVIDALGLTRVDFDVEGAALGDPTAVRRRNRAIRLLQVAAQRQGTPLRVSYTVPADSGPLTGGAAALLRDARAAGVVIEAVNVMAMDYRTPPADMAGQAMAVAASTEAFVRRLWPTSEEQAWRMVAVTSMIGRNDIVSETFRQGDAARLVEFARRHGVGWLSFWSLNRDRPCAGDAAQEARNRASATCSGVIQRPGEFTRIFAGH